MSRSPIRFTASALALTLCAGVGTPTNALAAEPRVPAPTLMQKAADPVPAYVGLRIDAKALGADAEPIAAKVEEQTKAVFEAEGVLAPLDEQDPVIVVVVERARNSEDPGYVIGFSIEQGEDVVPGSARQSDCSLCTRTELIERIEAELPKLIELAREYQVVRAVDEGGGEEDGSADEAEDEGGEEGGSEPVKKIGPLGFAGIGLGVVGLGGVGAGVALAVKGFVPIANEAGQFKDYRTPGNVILAVGGAALIAGVVMIAIDVSKRKNQRKAAGARVQWAGAGLAF
ncbi:hypothetical protein ACNOYE_21975 [Nannocystaceae bacterium ST9]